MQLIQSNEFRSNNKIGREKCCVDAIWTLSGYLLMCWSLGGPLTLNLSCQTNSMKCSLASRDRPLLDAPAIYNRLEPFSTLWPLIPPSPSSLFPPMLMFNTHFPHLGLCISLDFSVFYSNWQTGAQTSRSNKHGSFCVWSLCTVLVREAKITSSFPWKVTHMR